MKKILLILCLIPFLGYSQVSYKIKADSTILSNIGSGKNELVIRNATSNITGGVLTNLGNGVTAFVLGGGSARVVDTIYKNNTKDSIVFTISGIRYAVKDSFNLNTDSQTLSISNDTLTISGGNSVILPVYVQADSSTIFSYDVLNSQNAPPGSPAIGDTYLVGNSPSGAWAGHAKDIAEWNGSSWGFIDAVQGDFLYNTTNALTYIFRSGNWVQTTALPALNNGNNISSGLTIGTNNLKALNFETNNVKRGRIDSSGRLHIYNLPTSSTGDTFVVSSNSLGYFSKVGKNAFLAGISGGASGIDSIYYPRTYAQLRTAMSAHTLVKGANYKMTDFATIYDQPDFHANGTPKDTVVTKTASVELLVFVATSDSTFAEAVSSIEFPNDQIMFDWTFTETEVMNAPAKGRIKQRIDDHFNRADYDFRKVLFLRYESSTGSGIFSSWKDNGESSSEFLTFDYSISFDNYIADSKITHGLLSTPFILPNIVANGLFAGMKIGSNSRNLTWMQGADGSEVSAFCSDLTFFDGFHYNYIGGHSTGVSCVGLFTDNYFGNLESVAFSGRVEQNSCWDVIKTTTIGDGFQYNIQYGVIEDCVIGSDMSECVLYGFNNTMTIGNGNTKCKWWDANNNTIGDDNINVDFSSTANLSASNDLSGLHNVIFSGGIDATGWVNFITNGTHPEMYLTYPKTVIIGSNGSVYTRYFNGATDVITVIN